MTEIIYNRNQYLFEINNYNLLTLYSGNKIVHYNTRGDCKIIIKKYPYVTSYLIVVSCVRGDCDFVNGTYTVVDNNIVFGKFAMTFYCSCSKKYFSVAIDRSTMNDLKNKFNIN